MQESKNYILKIDCSDEKGLIYRIADVVFKYQLNIIKNDEFVDRDNGKFFMRAELSGEMNMSAFKGTLEAMLPAHADIYVAEARKKDIILMGTKETHCLGDILLKHDSDDLNANILAIVSNYEDLKGLSDKFNIPFHCVSHEGLNRAEHEAKVLEVLSAYTVDYIVLAKYMRILSSEFVGHYEEKMINIHHSFLPAFIGANPYKQAFSRGVKIIGATAHFVNNNLDEGPIIAQDVIHVNHEMTWKDMQRAGRNVEKNVLSNALDLVFEERIFVHDNKTIIF
ncbi:MULTISPECIES: formyltetrahydrofolate deformylase [Sulfurospirillum]|uniref:Formyltetrahydrofolate deformylase n=2 Tax=Sulfurospirillum multivorans TaxID=66821 RepID=A0AA86E007_SULMK|nr:MULTISPECIES: formyltetrahydrofolate deformylase [Sulfurospirillum]AHJ13405.1 formyltetrahydrofolate deformylase [Sulfurospirillum multivorans DSM 12446]KFL35065.1 formyltetrahydrofolate deformylase [Sulfurospirillum sp. SCADC]QEH06896.1 formyltetrahydrofolate deformylase [Sulfurospirillum multivorans]